jgi:hemerythrin-like domain-containing protein
MSESIEEIMIKEHGLVEAFLREFERCENSPEKGLQMLGKFRWALEKHFLLEEKAIFDVLNELQGVEVSETFELLRDHQQIIELIKNIEEGYSEGMIVDLQRVRDLLEKHLEMEVVFFYPKLDRVLNEETKQKILEKAKELIRS